MIIYLLFQIVFVLLDAILSLIELPSMPDIFYDYYDIFIQVIQDSIGLVSLFIPMDLVLFLLPLVVTMANWHYIYSALMWIVKKIPVIGVK